MDKTALALITGLGGMIGWGTSDFFAAKTIAKIGDYKTFFWGQLFGLLANIVLLIYYIPSSLDFDLRFFGLSVLVSVAYLLGYVMLYTAFSKGELSIVSPIASTNTIFTVLVALFLYKQQITDLQSIAIWIVIIGAILVSVNFSKLRSGKISLTAGVKEVLFAAILFGFIFWPVNEYITERTSWIAFNVIVKVSALIMFYVYQTFFMKSLKLSEIPKGSWKQLALIGLLDVLGVLSVGYGLSVADSALVAPISSAFSVVTVLLAAIFLKEKTTWTQKIGIAMTIAGIVMVVM